MNTCDNKRPCPCTYACPRHGKCCECVAHHRDHDEGVPACFSPRKRKRHTTGALRLCAETEAFSLHGAKLDAAA